MNFSKKLLNKTSAYSIVVLFTVAGILLFVFHKKQDFVNLENFNEKQTPRTLRCGVDSLYLSINILTGNSGDLLYHNLGRQFPDVEKEGISLGHIKDYWEREGFVCRYVRVEKRVVEKLKKDSVIFLLRENNEIPHICLLWRRGEDEFRIIDSVKGIENRDMRGIEKLDIIGLLVAKELEAEETFFAQHSLSGALFAGGVLVLCFGIYRQRRRKS